MISDAVTIFVDFMCCCMKTSNIYFFFKTSIVPLIPIQTFFKYKMNL